MPRVLLGLAAYEVYRFLTEKGVSLYVRTAVTAIAATILHTLMFLGSYTALIGGTYAEANGIPFANVVNIMIGITVVNGIPEAVVSGIIVTPVITALRKAGIIMK